MYPSGVRQQKLSKSCQNRFSISKPLCRSAYRRTADVAVADEEDLYHRKSAPVVLNIDAKYALLVRVFESTEVLLLLE
jgi:hypothetical protein